MAMGICSFTLIALIGLFSVGLKDSRDSMNDFEAANLASQLIAARCASPTKEIPALSGTFAIPAAAMTQAYGNAYGSPTNYVGLDGNLATSDKAAYAITCLSGTTSRTGTQMAQVYLRLTWPVKAAAANASGKYEILTYIPLR